MSKRRQTMRVRIPPYKHPRNEWRRSIHTELVNASASQRVSYRTGDRLELLITLYIPEKQIGWHDVDNRLKDIMDALQGRAGGAKKNHGLAPIVPNDHQIQKVTVEKLTPPPQSHSWGHLIIRKRKDAASRVIRRSGATPSGINRFP